VILLLGDFFIRHLRVDILQAREETYTLQRVLEVIESMLDLGAFSLRVKGYSA
jgi:hypothetical protein